MKRSVFTKEYTGTGKMGTFTGKVIVTMNDSSIKIKGTHANTHEDFKKEVPTHKVEAFIGNELLYSTDGIESESEVLDRTKEIKQRVIGRLQVLATTGPEKTFREKIIETLND